MPDFTAHQGPNFSYCERCTLLFAMVLTEAVQNRVSQIVSEAKCSGSHVSSWDRMVKLLESHDLSWEAPAIPPSHVAVHPENTSSMMLGPVQMNVLGPKIAVQGWSPERAKGVCIQMPTDAAARAAILDKNNFTCRPSPTTTNPPTKKRKRFVHIGLTLHAYHIFRGASEHARSCNPEL